MLLRLRITILLSHAKVDNVDDVGTLRTGATNQEIVRLDVSVDEVLLVDGLHPGKLMSCQFYTLQTTR